MGVIVLWLSMGACGGGETAAKTLWQDTGVRVLPGGYLAQDSGDGAYPGADLVRVARVDEEPTTREKLRRLVATPG